jgi:DNA-binding transcriptional MocR family regulator
MTSWAPILRPASGPLYLALAEAIAEDVGHGRLKTGDRLPTHRDLADRLGVTVGTVSRGYAEAARRGLLSGEIGRGTFVRGPAAEYEIARTSAEMGQAPGFVDLGVNHPPSPPSEPHGRALARALAALAVRPDLARLLDYPPEGGQPSHREAGAEWLRRTGLRCGADQVLVCGGSQHGLLSALATLLEPGDLLLTEGLTYAGLKAAASVLRLRLHGLPLDAHGVVPESLEAACRRGGVKALYCVPTIQNPTCSVMPVERRRALADIARAHGVTIVEDDVHARLAADAPLPIQTLAPERTVYVTSTSKTLAPGLRVGFVCAPPALVGRVATAIRATTWAAPPLMGEVVAGWIADGTAESLLEERRREAALRQEKARAALGHARYVAHPSSYHLWLELPAGWRSESFSASARRRGVGVTPAESFLIEGTAPGAVRLCLGGARSRAAVDLGLLRVAETLASAPDEGLAVV